MRIDRRTGLNVGVVIAVCVAGPHASAAGAFAPSALRPSRALPGVRLCRAEGINGCGVSVFLAGRESGQGSGKSEQGVSGSQPLPVRRRPGKWGKGRRSDATTSDPAPTPDIERLASVVAAEFATSEEWTRVSDEFLNIYTPSVCRPGAAEYMRGLCNADESEVLRWIRAETRRRFSAEEASMQIFPEQGKWLSQLVMTMNATKVLELGSFTGYSSTCLASAMSPGGHLFCVDISDVYTSLAREAWQRAGLEDRVSLHIGPAAEYLESMLAPGQENRSTFDLIFIDADKENYLPYYRAALQLVRPGGAICIDDTLWSGRVVQDSGCSDRETESIRHVNAFLANDPRVLTLVHPIGDGITVAIRKPHHGQVRRRINDPEGGSLAAADTGAFAAHEAWRHPDRPREEGRGATPPMRSETASAEEWGVQVGAEEGGGVEPADAIPCSRPGGEGRDDENAAGEGAGRRRRRRRVGWAKQVSRGGAEEGEERALEREILANIATDGARASALGASVGAEGTSAAVAPYPCALQIQGNFGAGKQELAVHLTAFLESASRRSLAEFPGASKTSETLGLRRVPGEVVVGEWAAQGLLDSMASRPLGTTARERGPREESAGLVVFLDTPPDVCVQRGRVAHPSLGDGSKDAVFQENLRRVDDFLFEKILEQLLDTREGEDERSTASKVEGLLVLDWREVGRPGDVFNMVRGALDGAYQLPQVVRAPSAWRAPRDAYVVTVDELAEMGQGLSEGVDVLATDPRATPGSFLQVTASLLEGAYAMGLQADLTIADTEADGARASTIYVCYPSSLQPPPGYSEREWGLAREAFKRLVLHLLSRLRSVVLVDPV